MSRKPNMRAISLAARRAAQSQVTRIMRDKVNKEKRWLISQFLAHPVTQEILGGLNASNISNTLRDVPIYAVDDNDVKPNLYSFIGFESGDDPIGVILKALESIEFREVKVTSTGFYCVVNAPSAKDIFNITPMPWAEGRSWAQGIETGISGVGYYLAVLAKASRSGGGIQVKNKVRGGRFRNMPYISSLIKQFKRRLQNEAPVPTHFSEQFSIVD